jgi:hypothetical protein
MKHFFALLVCLGPLALWAQQAETPSPPGAPIQTARTELLLDPYSDEVAVQTLPSDSAVVLLISRQPKLVGPTQYYFAHYRSNLVLHREKAVEIKDEYDIVRLCSEPGVVYALFRSRITPGRLLVAAYDARGGQVRTQEFDTKQYRHLVSVRAVDGRLLATVTLADQLHQTVLLLDVATGRFQFLPSLYEPLTTELTSVMDAPAGRAEFILSQTNGRKQRLMLKQLSAEQGQLLRSELVQTESERTLITAQLSPPQDTSARLLAGTYGLRGPQYAQGLFTTDLTAPPANPNDPRPALRFYDFRRLRHFFEYLNPAKEARLRTRSARRDEREEAPLRWHYRLLLHELLPQPGGGYTLVAEVYYPRYIYNSYGPTSSLNGLGGFNNPGTYGQAYNVPGRTLLGIRTTHVLVCGFDRKGSLLWDNSYVVDSDLLHSELEEAVRTLTLPDGRLVLAYLLENELHYKLINQGQDGPNDLKVPIFTAGPSIKEKVLDTSQPDVQPLSGRQYVASGFQRIQSERMPERQVFFLQTLNF